MILYLFACSRNKFRFAILNNPEGRGVSDDYCNADAEDYRNHPLKFITSFSADNPDETPLTNFGFGYTNREMIDFISKYGHGTTLLCSLEEDEEEVD